MGLYSLSGKTSYRRISWNIEAAKLDVIMIVSLWYLTDIFAALLLRCLIHFKAIGKVLIRILRFRNLTRSCRKLSIPKCIDVLRLYKKGMFLMLRYIMWYFNRCSLFLTSHGKIFEAKIKGNSISFYIAYSCFRVYLDHGGDWLWMCLYVGYKRWGNCFQTAENLYTALRELNNLYFSYEKYPLSPLKPRGLALLSWHVPYNWGSGNSVHQSFTWFLSLNWRKSTFSAPGCRYYFKINSWWPIVTSSTHGPAARYCDVTKIHCSHGYLWTHDVEVDAS